MNSIYPVLEATPKEIQLPTPENTQYDPLSLHKQNSVTVVSLDRGTVDVSAILRVTWERYLCLSSITQFPSMVTS